jgi:hypothetical protein
MTDQKEKFILFAIYKNPSDYPGKYVVRRWEGLVADRQPVIVADELKQAREAIPDHMYRLDRLEGDDPAILETWI